MEFWLRPLVYAGLVGLLFAPLERLAPARASERDASSLRTDLGFATVGAVMTHALIALLAGATLAGLSGLAAPLSGAPTWLSLPLGLLVFELAGYAYHRAAHAFGPLRRLHDVHHAAAHMDWLAGFRQHPLEVALMTLAQNAPLALLGLPLAEHAAVVALLQVNTIFVHANVRTPGWLARWIATPRFHHRHHDRDAPLANFATLFPWIDRLFGTASDARAGAFGLPGPRREGFVASLLAPLLAPVRRGCGRPAGRRRPARADRPA